MRLECKIKKSIVSAKSGNIIPSALHTCTRLSMCLRALDLSVELQANSQFFSDDSETHRSSGKVDAAKNFARPRSRAIEHVFLPLA